MVFAELSLSFSPSPSVCSFGSLTTFKLVSRSVSIKPIHCCLLVYFFYWASCKLTRTAVITRIGTLATVGWDSPECVARMFLKFFSFNYSNKICRKKYYCLYMGDRIAQQVNRAWRRSIGCHEKMKNNLFTIIAATWTLSSWRREFLLNPKFLACGHHNRYHLPSFAAS